MNPVSYAEQVQKRKMLWKKKDTDAAADSGKKSNTNANPTPNSNTEQSIFGGGPSSAPPTKPTSFNKWEATNFGDDQANEKFRRMMGIKTAAKPEEFKVCTVPNFKLFFIKVLKRQVLFV